jgi:hypothetical protein
MEEAVKGEERRKDRGSDTEERIERGMVENIK